MTDIRKQLVDRLRSACDDVRRKSFPLSELIPLMQQAADVLAAQHQQEARGLHDLEMAASLMDEAASILAAVSPDVLEKIPAYRWPLCDELGGAAGILRDGIKGE